MKAIVYYRYGSPEVLQLQEIDRPLCRDDGVLVKIRAAAVNPYDWHFMRGEPYFMRLLFGLRAPKRNGLGVDFSGQVDEVGQKVTQFRPGDEVFGMCDGSFAEYLCCAERDMAPKPASASFVQAAAIPLAGLTALQGLRDAGRLQVGERVLIIGASGGVGSFAVQLAKLLGAHATGVCSTANLEMVRALGADEVIDYTKEEFTLSGQKYDLILQLGGMHSPNHCRSALTPTGRLILSSGDSDGRWLGPLDRIFAAAALSPFVSQTLRALDVKRSGDDLRFLANLIDAGKLKTVIDRTLSLSDVPEAIRYVEQRHSRGKVVITL
jgi:NADPH:quinone reductase-like Zn-dependent oxidoreductase